MGKQRLRGGRQPERGGKRGGRPVKPERGGKGGGESYGQDEIDRKGVFNGFKSKQSRLEGNAQRLNSWTAFIKPYANSKQERRKKDK